MSEQKNKKPSPTRRSEERIRRNHEILGMLKAGVSAREDVKLHKSLSSVTQEERKFVQN